MMRARVSVVAAMLVVVSLCACAESGDSGRGDSRGGASDYCSTLQSSLTNAQFPIYDPDFTNMDEPTFRDMQSMTAVLGDLAPEELADDWKALRTGNERSRSLLADAGLSLEDLQRWDDGELPVRESRAVGRRLLEVNPTLQAFAEKSGYEKALHAIEKHAETECGLSSP
jgi:hypothetical protein